MSGWNTNIPIFSLIIGPFPKGYIYHTCFQPKEEAALRRGDQTSISRVFLSRFSFSMFFSFYMILSSFLELFWKIQLLGDIL